MKKIKISTNFDIYQSLNDLPSEEFELMRQAIEARKEAYAPYSKFSVGAAVLLDNGEIITGSNQENAAYPSGLCAERVAIFYACAKFPETQILKLAISATASNDRTVVPIPPCGACRQSIIEYEFKQKTPIEIIFMGASGNVAKSASMANLLPLGFDNSYLFSDI
ncbi:MAG: cytidine deaminase [Flavobacteriales bacterium CG_4_9_14_3_um_filter_40_17]|nr:MAG: cytidine deaminase [Flavobacteriales bacterium CG_4_9_14_3_um_filter_40_17]